MDTSPILARKKDHRITTRPPAPNWAMPPIDRPRQKQTADLRWSAAILKPCAADSVPGPLQDTGQGIARIAQLILEEGMLQPLQSPATAQPSPFQQEARVSSSIRFLLNRGTMLQGIGSLLILPSFPGRRCLSCISALLLPGITATTRKQRSPHGPRAKPRQIPRHESIEDTPPRTNNQPFPTSWSRLSSFFLVSSIKIHRGERCTHAHKEGKNFAQPSSWMQCMPRGQRQQQQRQKHYAIKLHGPTDYIGRAFAARPAPLY